ncbi:hypothetical protein [Corticicoccus populi]|uniref:Uncharacterized protein n=1 Tax=Corticicoccus populi TaxID=1812821 RepID=A0ABW5WXY3_9STAP
MTKLFTNLNLSITASRGTPYFLVSKDNRIRFDINYVNHNILNNIFSLLNISSGDLNLIYLDDVERFGKKYREDTSTVNDFFQTNEFEIISIKDEEENNKILNFHQIKNCKENDIINYILHISKGGYSNLLYFYSDNMIIKVGPDIMDIVHEDSNTITLMKVQFNGLYDKYYE